MKSKPGFRLPHVVLLLCSLFWRLEMCSRYYKSHYCFENNFSQLSKCLTFNKSCFPVLITICVLLSILNRNASIVSFTFGVFNLVFWLLTYCQCPFPCDQYEGTTY